MTPVTDLDGSGDGPVVGGERTVRGVLREGRTVKGELREGRTVRGVLRGVDTTT